MTPQQALQIIDSVLAQVSVNRQQHAQIAQAVRIIHDAITPKEEQKPEQ